jgi:transposase
MVWVYVWSRNRGTFCPLNVESVNKGGYVKLLEYFLLPLLKRVHNTLGDSFFPQANAPVHKPAVVMDLFKKYNIQVEDWPPYSPDLNPIEHVWVELKRRLHRRYPDIGNTEGGPDIVNARLPEVLHEIWVEIPEAYFEKL